MDLHAVNYGLICYYQGEAAQLAGLLVHMYSMHPVFERGN